MIGELDGAHRGKHPLQHGLALRQRERAQIEPLQRQQIESIERGRQLHGGAQDIVPLRETAALLQSLETRPPLVVVNHHLPVQDEIVVRERLDGVRDFGKDGGEVVSVTGQEHGLARAAFPSTEKAVPVVLQLEEPVGIRERVVPCLRKHQSHVTHFDGPHFRFEAGQSLSRFGAQIPPGLQLLDGEPGEHRVLRKGLLAIRRHPRIALLDHQPFFAVALLDAHKSPRSMKLVAPQFKEQLAFLHPLIEIALGNPQSSIPHNHCSRAVIAFRDDSLEIRILDRVVFRLHCEALVLLIERGSFGHGPRLQHAVVLEAKVVMETSSEVLLHYEQPASTAAADPERLRCGPRRALSAVRLQSIRSGLICCGH